MPSVSIRNIEDRLLDGKYAGLQTYYFANDIIDFYKSDSWNKKAVANKNKEIAEHNKNFIKNKKPVTETFKEELIEAIANDLYFNTKQAEVIFESAWNIGNKQGLAEVIKTVNILVSVITRIDILKN